MVQKTDNYWLTAKLELRRHFLTKYHSDGPIHVLDCCQGNGILWGRLREEFKVATYWGVDVKPKKGRLKIDSVRILSQPGWPQNVVDIDTYGSPWKHWEALLANISQPTTTFLTVVQMFMVGGFQIKGSPDAARAIGLGHLIRRCPNLLLAKITKMAVTYCLTRTCDYGISLVEAVEAISSGNARYIGVRLEPSTKANGREVAASGRSEQPEPDRRSKHV